MKNSPTIGPVMIDFEGLSLSEIEIKRLESPLVGGVILFTRNFESPDQLAQLVKQIRSIKPQVIIAVDHEGGRVQRFRTGFTRLPCMASLGSVYKKDVGEALHLARELGWLMAAELRAFDIDISFAPVMDRDHGISAVIGDRAYSSDPKAIVELCSSFIEGMHEAGMASTGKHFPGHGAVEADSHTDIPIDDRPQSVIEQEDMSIFRQLSQRGMDAVMPAHVIYTAVDSLPAGFSSIWIDILRNECSFDGVVFSDDLSMEGASVAGSFEERADAALKAGCDMVLVCNDPVAADLVIEHLLGGGVSVNEKSEARLLRMQGSGNYTMEELQASERWKAAVLLTQKLMVSGG